MTTEFTNWLDKLNVKYCFNEQDYELSKLKYIIVGDNPGNTEYIEKKKNHRNFWAKIKKTLRVK